MSYTIPTGRVLCVHSTNSLLGKAIQFVLNSIRVMRGLPRKPDIINHVELIHNVGGLLMTSTARWKVTMQRFVDAYPKGKKQRKYLKVYKFPVEFTPTEKSRLIINAKYYVNKKVGYDVISLVIYQPILQLTGKWIGPKGVDAKTYQYCSEHTATVINEVKPEYCQEPWKLDPESFSKQPLILDEEATYLIQNSLE